MYMKVLRDESMMVRNKAAAPLARIGASAQAAASALTAVENTPDVLKRIRI